MEKAIFQNEETAQGFYMVPAQGFSPEHEQLIGRQKVTLHRAILMEDIKQQWNLICHLQQHGVI